MSLKRKAVLGALKAAKIGFQFGSAITKANLNAANDMAGYFTGVQMPNRIGDALLDCGEKSVGFMFKLAEKAAKKIH